jgi:hypothetical protein
MDFKLNSSLCKEVYLGDLPCRRSKTIARSHGAHGVTRPTFKGEVENQGMGEQVHGNASTGDQDQDQEKGPSTTRRGWFREKEPWSLDTRFLIG